MKDDSYDRMVFCHDCLSKLLYKDESERENKKIYDEMADDIKQFWPDQTDIIAWIRAHGK